MYQPLPKKFDLILSQQVLEHLIEPEDALRNLAAMLQPRGVILIAVPDGRLDDFAGHIHFWSKDSLPLFLQKTLPGYIVRTGSLQDGVSLYGVLSRRIAGEVAEGQKRNIQDQELKKEDIDKKVIDQVEDDGNEK